MFATQQLKAQAFVTEVGNWRRIAHIIADTVYERLTGESGYFDTRVVYIAESGPANKRVKRLAIMDQDGANHRFLTDGADLVLTPRFSPNTQEITYMSYYNGVPRVYLYNIDSGQRERLGDFPGMTFAPRFSPDGNSVIMSMARGGTSDITTGLAHLSAPAPPTARRSTLALVSLRVGFARIVFNPTRAATALYFMNATVRNPAHHHRPGPITRLRVAAPRRPSPSQNTRAPLHRVSPRRTGERLLPTVSMSKDRRGRPTPGFDVLSQTERHPRPRLRNPIYSVI